MPEKAIRRREGRYSEEKRIDCAIQYALSGNARKVAKATGISEPTICDWRKQEWWDNVIEQVRSEKSDELRAKYEAIAIEALDHTRKKLPDATAAQAATISGICFDKTRLIDNQPTSISNNTGSMAQLAKEFARLSRERKVVSSQDGQGNET